MRKQMKKTAAILMAALLAVSTLAAPADAATSYTTVTAPGSFTSSDSSDNTLSVIAYYNTDQSETVSDLTIEDSTSGVNGIVVDNADVDFSDITITLDTDADGSDTCDFTGKGTAFAVYGDSDVTLSDAAITATGVATMPLFIDDGAVLTVHDTTITSNGGTLYSSYVNTADQSVMVSPPWVLGIMGTSRASNLMGTGSTLNFLDSTAYAAMWAVLSTDSGSDMVMNVYNSTLQLTRRDESSVAIQEDGGQITTYDNPYTTSYGAGYGTYVIGDVTETMVGVTMNVGTYAAIFTGGTMSFSTLTAGDYTLSNADGSTTSYTYSDDTRSSVINSDTFGFMAHQGDNTLTLGSGTSLNTGYTGFLIKTGGSLSSFTADITNTSIDAGDNVLIQVLDNEDSLIGTSSGSTFATTYTESSGWLASDSSDDSGDSGDSGSGGSGGPGDGSSGGGESGGPGGGSSGGGPGGSQGNGISTTAATDSSSSDSVIFNFTGESALTGNIYNSSGDQLTGTGVTVNLSDTTYYGAAASTTAIHVTYEGAQYVRDTLNGYAVEADDEGEEVLSYQNTEITISEYYDLGHVANKINSNGSNTVTISLTDDSTWYVTGTSVLSSLSVEDGSQVILVGDATLTVNGTTYSADNLGDNMSHVDSLDDEEEEACEHDYEAVVTDPTCTEQGYTTYTCTLCGDSYVADYTEATGHSYSSEITTEATCTEDGEMTYTCTVCGDSYTETIEATGHSYEAVVTEPICTEQGYTTYTCMVCGDSYVADYTEALGHTWDDGVVTSEATETEAGEITYTCTVCGETRTEEIAPTGEHTWEEGEVTTEATCTEDGVMTYTCT
ncbi:MAG: hypothetical protein LUF34_05825, partial [Lachnospiraceae bacterium]|nr:hypothetical protein [Lachnospiraceae bacterium]